MKQKQRYFLPVLALVLVLCLLPANVNAEDLTYTTTEGHTYSYALSNDQTTVTITGFSFDRFVNLLMIPETIDGKPVTAIGPHVLDNCWTSILIIPDSVKSIGASDIRHVDLTEVHYKGNRSDLNIDPEGNGGVIACLKHNWDGEQCSVCQFTCVHTGGTANCNSGAICDHCGYAYGELNPAVHASAETCYSNVGDGKHQLAYKCCEALIGTEQLPHVFDEENKCTDCGEHYNVVVTHTSGHYGFGGVNNALTLAKTLDNAVVRLARYSEGSGDGYTVDSGKFTIDLNGCSLSSSGSTTLTVKSGADVTIELGGGYITSSAGNGVYVESGAKLTVTDTVGGGYMKSYNSGSNVFAIMSNGEVHLTGGHMKERSTGDKWSVYVNSGSLHLDGATVDGIFVNQSDSTVILSGDAPNSPGICWLNHKVSVPAAITGDDTYTSGSTAGTILAEGINGYVLTEADALRFDADSILAPVVDAANNRIVLKRKITENRVSLSESTYTYDGTAHQPEVTVTYSNTNLTQDTDYTVAYSNNIDAGTATVTVTGIGDYVDSVAVNFTIAKAPAPAIQFPTVLNAITYGQQLREAKLSFYENTYGTFNWNAPAGVPNAGLTAPALDFYPSQTYLHNYNWMDANGAQWIESRNALCICPNVTVNKALVPFTAPKPNTLTYNTQAQALVTAGSSEKGTIYYSMSQTDGYSETIPTAVNAGEYTLWYRVEPLGTANENNYYAQESTALTIKVGKATPELTNVHAEVLENSTDLSNVVVTYTITPGASGRIALEEGQTLSLGDNTLRFTFYPEDTANVNPTAATVKVTVVDTVAPTGTVRISADTWNSFLNTITFGKYFKQTQTLTVTAADSFSGVAKVEYAQRSEALTLDAVKTITDWKQMADSVSITAEDAKRFVYYVRITDNSGNVTYLSSDGMTFDTSAPVISGVSNGVTYHTTQTVSITDANLDAVTVNGNVITGTVALAGDQEATYTIQATDKAGNTAAITVKMAPISDISKSVADLTAATVTTADQEKLEQVQADIQALLQQENLPAAEKETLEKARNHTETLLKQIEASVDALQTESVENTLDTTAENVKLTEKTDIQAAIQTIESAMQTYESTYTDGDKKQLQSQLDALKAAAAVIANVESVQQSVSALPKTVQPDEEAVAEKILAAKTAYDALTAYEKTLAKEEGEKLAALLADLTDYDIIDGDGAKFTGETLTFIANGPVSKFVSLKINGSVVDSKHYTVRSGSTIITLSKDYLKTLGEGIHEITVVYTDGQTSATFQVPETKVNAPTVPNTVDDADLTLWLTLMLTAMGVAVLLVKKRPCAK